MKASDSKDKVYGLIGLATDAKELGILPDYTKTCAQVYTEVALKLMQHGHTSILSFCQLPKAMQGLPSWVPDLSIPLEYQLQHSQIGKDPELTPEFYASGKSRAVIQSSLTAENKSVLTLTGLLLDDVHAIGRTMDEIISTEHLMYVVKHWLLGLDGLIDLRQGPYDNDGKRNAAVFHTSTAAYRNDITVGTGKRSGTTMEEFAQFAMILLTGADEAEIKRHTWLVELLQRKGLPPRINEDALVAFDHGRYVDDINMRARGRKPFITAKGNLGLGSLELEKGDRVAIF
jgi:hypothetical protein